MRKGVPGVPGTARKNSRRGQVSGRHDLKKGHQSITRLPTNCLQNVNHFNRLAAHHGFI